MIGKEFPEKSIYGTGKKNMLTSAAAAVTTTLPSPHDVMSSYSHTVGRKALGCCMLGNKENFAPTQRPGRKKNKKKNEPPPASHKRVGACLADLSLCTVEDDHGHHTHEAHTPFGYQTALICGALVGSIGTQA